MANRQPNLLHFTLAFHPSIYDTVAEGGQFGCCEQADIDVLLLNFCRSHSALRMRALIGSLEQVGKWNRTSFTNQTLMSAPIMWCTQLNEIKIVWSWAFLGAAAAGYQQHQQQQQQQQVPN